MTLKAFSYRFYPTPEQESLLRPFTIEDISELAIVVNDR
ncbi:MAG: helix-turn-helix domain-containing protein [Microcoleus sp.]